MWTVSHWQGTSPDTNCHANDDQDKEEVEGGDWIQLLEYMYNFCQSATKNTFPLHVFQSSYNLKSSTTSGTSGLQLHQQGQEH